MIKPLRFGIASGFRLSVTRSLPIFTDMVMPSISGTTRSGFWLLLRAGLLALTALGGLSGCSWLVSSATGSFGEQFAQTLAESDDPVMVSDALPTYLLTLDSLLRESDSPSLYRAAAQLNGLYGGQFALEHGQKQRLLDKAWGYAQQSACLEDKQWCRMDRFSHDELRQVLDNSSKKQVATLYLLGSQWAGWIEAHSGDWNAVAKIGQVRALMETVLLLDEQYDHGAAHLYLGVLSTLIPPALGGKPEQGKLHFERAIELSAGKNLMARVLYAEKYARLVFDQELHNQLLREVLAEDPHQGVFTLANVLAQKKARQLLAESNDYF